MTELQQERNLSRTKDFDGSAILLAAGVGRRLGAAHDGPKVLLDFEGKSLLERTIESLYEYGVRRLTITVGFQAGSIRHAVSTLLDSARFTSLNVAFVDNPRFRNGSLLSLNCQAETLRNGGEILLLDGDVLYDGAMIGRLLGSDSEGVLLVDREIEPGDEPVKICFDARGQIVDFRKVPANAYAWFGESVGFFRFSGPIAAALADGCAGYAAKDAPETEYEEAIRDLILKDPSRFTATDVSDLAWTEIDFPEDVVKAREIVLPQLKA